jgi:hypothetical protein
MSIKNVYEVFDDFKKASTKAERLEVLRKNNSYAVKNVLMGAFDPRVVFNVDKIPEFKREKMPAGMGYSNMTTELGRIYLFIKDHPRTPEGLTEKRKTELLIQILESLEEEEADVFVAMLTKKLKIPHLTPALINEAFPGLIQVS